MAYLELSLFSPTLSFETNLQVVLADNPATAPCLLLLHGASDDDTTWMRRTSIERYAERHGLSVVMPNGHLSCFADMRYGAAYETFLMQELPAFLHGHLGLPTARELNLVAGLSMGGYGALRLGLRHPERFATVGCFSSGNLLVAREADSTNIPPDPNQWIHLVMGREPDSAAPVGDPDFDLCAIFERQVKAGAALPRIYLTCGTEDYLLDCSRRTAARLAELPAWQFTYTESAGAHNWDFWDRCVQDFLAWASEPPEGK